MLWFQACPDFREIKIRSIKIFKIIDNIEVPIQAQTRTRSRGALGQALDSLEIGQGFYFSDARTMKAMYPVVAPKRFPSVDGKLKKFKIWEEGLSDIEGEFRYGVKRLNDVNAT